MPSAPASIPLVVARPKKDSGAATFRVKVVKVAGDRRDGSGMTEDALATQLPQLVRHRERRR
jgi:uncharacterized protein (DUF433 family)